LERFYFISFFIIMKFLIEVEIKDEKVVSMELLKPKIPVKYFELYEKGKRNIPFLEEIMLWKRLKCEVL